MSLKTVKYGFRVVPPNGIRPSSPTPQAAPQESDEHPEQQGTPPRPQPHALERNPEGLGPGHREGRARPPRQGHEGPGHEAPLPVQAEGQVESAGVRRVCSRRGGASREAREVKFESVFKEVDPPPPRRERRKGLAVWRFLGRFPAPGSGGAPRSPPFSGSLAPVPPVGCAVVTGTTGDRVKALGVFEPSVPARLLGRSGPSPFCAQGEERTPTEQNVCSQS